MKLTKNGSRLIIGLMTGIGFFGVTAALIFFAIPVTNKDVLNTICGFLGGAFVTAVTFYFGDSEGRQ